MINKNSEREIGVHPEGQKSKIAAGSYFNLSSKMEIMPRGISERDGVCDLSHPIL